MRQLAFAGFVVFWTCVLTLVAVGVLSPTARPKSERAVVYTMAEVSRHNTQDDCWMAIRGNVYDFSTYISEHPTPPEVMTQWCGQEATEAYETKGYDAPHSDAADRLLEQYWIGVLAPSR